jgi:hypothetical protein
MKPANQFIAGAALAIFVSSTGLAQSNNGGPAVIAPPDSFFEIVSQRDREVARRFYKKFLDVKGMPVVASREVADLALQRTYSIVNVTNSAPNASNSDDRTAI